MVSNMTPPDIAGTVRAELARQRKPQNGLQEKLKISRPTMHRRITGQSPFDANELVIVAEYLGMTVSELLGEQPTNTQAASA